MRYFVTGATGFIGGALVRRLREDGHEVVALVRNPAKASELSALGIELVKGDITDASTLAGPMAGCDGLFHLAAWYSLGRKGADKAEEINVQGTRNVLEAMKKAGIDKGVYTSSLAVFSDTKGRLVDESYRHDGPWISEYDRTKWGAHYEVALPMIEQGLPLVILQPGVIYGPGDHSAIHDSWQALMRGKMPGIPTQTTYCWSHVDDIVDAHILAMDKGKLGEAYVVGGEPHTLVEAIETASRIGKFKMPRLRFPPRLLKAMAGVMSLVDKVVMIEGQYAPEVLRVSAGPTYIASNAKAKRELGYDPRPIEEGFVDTMKWERAQLER